MRFINGLMGFVMMLGALGAEARALVGELYFKSSQGFLVGNLALDTDEAVLLKARLMISDTSDRLHTIKLAVYPHEEGEAVMTSETQHRLVKISDIGGQQWGEIDYSHHFNFKNDPNTTWKDGELYDFFLFVDGARVARSSFSYFVKKAARASDKE